MRLRSRFSVGARIGVLLIGAVISLAGLMARAFAEEHHLHDYETVDRGNGTVVVYQTDGPEPPLFEIELSPEGRAIVYALVADQEPDPVFSGTLEAAEQWVLAGGREPVFFGDRQAAAAWVQEQEEAEGSLLVPNLLVAGGVIIALLSLVLGWQRRSDET